MSYVRCKHIHPLLLRFLYLIYVQFFLVDSFFCATLYYFFKHFSTHCPVPLRFHEINLVLLIFVQSTYLLTNTTSRVDASRSSIKCINKRQQIECDPSKSRVQDGTIKQICWVVKNEGRGRLYSGLSRSLIGTAASQVELWAIRCVFRCLTNVILDGEL